MSYNNSNKNNVRPPASVFDVERERQLYYAFLDDPANRAEFEKALGPKIDLDRWLAACRDAVEVNPKLLAPNMRGSLLFAVKKAAQQTLRPDGKQGAIIPRYNSDAKTQLATWQPMIQGVLLLGRRAGVLRDFTAEIVFAGEPFKFLRGDRPEIIHEWMPDIREKAYGYLRRAPASSDPNGPPNDDPGGPDFESFWDMVVAAYCIVEGPDGSKTRRAMTRSRLLLLRDFSKSRGGPWQSVWLDEMIIKAATHHAMKHVDTVPKDGDSGRAFRAALDQDMDADLSNAEDDVIDARVNAAPTHPALSAPNAMDRLSTLSSRITAREKVAVDQERPMGDAAERGGDQGKDRSRPTQETTPTRGRQEPSQGERRRDPDMQDRGEGRPVADTQPPLAAVAETDPMIANDDGIDLDPSNEALAGIKAAQKWACRFRDKDLPTLKTEHDFEGLFGKAGFPNSGNAAVVKKLAWMAEYAPNSFAVLKAAINDKLNELKARTAA